MHRRAPLEAMASAMHKCHAPAHEATSSESFQDFFLLRARLPVPSLPIPVPIFFEHQKWDSSVSPFSGEGAQFLSPQVWELVVFPHLWKSISKTFFPDLKKLFLPAIYSMGNKEYFNLTSRCKIWWGWYVSCFVKIFFAFYQVQKVARLYY